MVVSRTFDGVKYAHSLTAASVILSDAIENDGRPWRHFSMALRSRLPTWDELRRAKDIFLGEDARAIQVLPPKAEYVNIHPYCLHLFVCLDGEPIPNFTDGGPTL